MIMITIEINLTLTKMNHLYKLVRCYVDVEKSEPSYISNGKLKFPVPFETVYTVMFHSYSICIYPLEACAQDEMCIQMFKLIIFRMA